MIDFEIVEGFKSLAFNGLHIKYLQMVTIRIK